MLRMNALERANDDLAALPAEAELAEPGMAAPVEEWDPTIRNRHLRKVCDGLTAMENARRAVSERQNGHRNLSDVSRQERKTARSLAKACGGCGLSEICEITDNLADWRGIHRLSHFEPGGPESREELLHRIKVDPQAPCIPPTPEAIA